MRSKLKAVLWILAIAALIAATKYFSVQELFRSILVGIERLGAWGPVRTAYTMNSRAKTRIPMLPNTTPKPFSMTLAGRYFPTRLPMVLPIKTPGMLQPTTCHTGCAESA